MDETEIQQLFFVLISDGRSAKRREAIARLTESPDREVQAMARIGRDVARIVHENGSTDTLPAVLQRLDVFPPTVYWHGFVEAAGQVLISTGLGVEGPRGIALQRAGLAAVARAQNGMFAMIATTLALVERVLPVDRPLAQRILQTNRSLAPDVRADKSIFKKRPPAFKPRAQRRAQ